MKKTLALVLVTLLLQACAARVPIPEVPIEEAQRRMPKEPPVVVADGCLYRRNLAYLNHYIIDESRELGTQGAKEVMAGFKEYGAVEIKQFVVPVMCATRMPPRNDEKGGRISQSESTQDKAKSLTFPEPLSPVVENDAALFAAYTQLFGDCDDQRYRKEKRYDCPLLTPEQALLLKTRLKTSYLVAVSVGGERVSGANRTAGAIFGLLLGGLSIASDAGTARVRLVNLDNGALVYSSYSRDFNGESPADFSGGGSVGGIEINEIWVKRMVKPLFEKQR